MFRTIAHPPDRAARIHNTFSASNMILNTPQGTQEVNKMVSEDFRNKLGSTYGQKTSKLAIATIFLAITDPNAIGQ